MAVDLPQMDQFARGGADAWDETQVNAPLNRDWFVPSLGPGLSRWNSAAWEVDPLKHWNGVVFDHYGVLKHWDGSQWVASPQIPTPPPPYVPPPPAPSLSIPLDGHTTGLWGAYSARRRMVPGYTGPLIRVTRISDSAVLDIGLYGDGLDTNALYAFLGPSGAGSIATLYDQSGNGRNFTSSTVAKRPLLALGAPQTEKAAFDGVTDGMFVAGFGGTFSGATFFLTGRLASTADQILLETSTDYNVNADTLLVYYSVSEGGMSVATHGTGASGNYARSSYTGELLNGVQAYRIDRNAAAFVDKTSLFVSGTKLTRTGNADVGTITGNFATNTLYFGGRNNGATFPARLDAFDLAVYQTALSDTDVADISTALEA